MKKVTEKKEKTETESVEETFRELIRDLARKTLDTPKVREAAAKRIEKKPSYVQAMLKQRGVGGMNSWVPLIAYCFELKGLDLNKLLERIVNDPSILDAQAKARPSEEKFRSLDRISIVNEDVKYQLVNTLEIMLKDLEKSLEGKRKKS